MGSSCLLSQVAVKTLPFYTDYFNVAYPLPKIDLIAIADFAAGSHTHAHMHTCTHARTHTRIHACTHAPTHTHARTHTHACTHTHIHTHTHTHSHTHAHTCTHTHTHTRTHAHTHTLPTGAMENWGLVTYR